MNEQLMRIIRSCKAGSLLSYTGGGSTIQGLRDFINNSSSSTLGRVPIIEMNKSELIKYINDNIKLPKLKHKLEHEPKNIINDAQAKEIDKKDPNNDDQPPQSPQPPQHQPPQHQPQPVNKTFVPIKKRVERQEKNEYDIGDNLKIKLTDYGGGGDCFYYVIGHYLSELGLIDKNLERNEQVRFLRGIVQDRFGALDENDDLYQNALNLLMVNSNKSQEEILSDIDNIYLSSNHYADDFDISMIQVKYKINLLVYNIMDNEFINTACKKEDNSEILILIANTKRKNNRRVDHFVGVEIYNNNELFLKTSQLQDLEDSQMVYLNSVNCI